MKKLRIIALILTICAVSALMFSCRNEKKLAESFAIPQLGSANACALEKGEIMVYETLKAEKDVDPYAVNSTTETYIKFVKGDSVEYDLTETETITSTGEVKLYEATYENGALTQSQDNETLTESDHTAPDIFSYFKIDYTVSDIEKITTAMTDNNMTLYVVTMTKDYSNKFDLDFGTVKSDCTEVVYNYYVDKSNVTRVVLSQFTSTLMTDSEPQTVTLFTQASIN